jgi:hypothetical protein
LTPTHRVLSNEGRMTPTRRVQQGRIPVRTAAFLLATLALTAACAVPAGGPGGSGAVLTGAQTRQPEDRIHRQAHEALARWADAIRKSGGASITFVGDLTGQIGDWEPALGDNKQALGAGLVRAAAPLSEDTPSGDKVRWLDGSTVDVNLLSAADTLQALVDAGSGSCDGCEPLEVAGAQLATGLVETSRGPANAPIWVFTIEGTAVKVTRVAVDEGVTVDPPPWNADDPPEGISIESAIGSEDSKKLTVSFTGAVEGASKPCGVDYSAEAVESDLAVVVILHATRNTTADPGTLCDLVGKTRTAKLTLDSALGSRAILEVRQGLPVPVTAP